MDITFGSLEQHARARLITPGYRELPVNTTLLYAAADPLAVHIDFPASVSAGGKPVTWTFARALLEEGLETPAGIGDVHVWPCGRSRTVMEFRSPHGIAVLRFQTRTLDRFLLRSYDLVEPGAEDLGPALDRGLVSMLGGV